MEKIRLVMRKILLVLLIVWMVGVFCLSHQNGENSGNLSRTIAMFFAGGDAETAENIEPVVRKVAHMTEYAVGAMLFYGLMLTYPKYTRKSRVLMTLGFIVFYAASDEIHQLFINSRNGSVGDVLIDTFGGAIGIGAMYVIEATITAMDNKVQEDLQNPKLRK